MEDIVLTSRRQRKKIQCKYAILRAARKCFQQNGYDETTVSQIAETADISYASFFNYFPTKESLLLEMAKEEYEDLMEEIKLQMIPDTLPLDKIQLMMLSMIRDTFSNQKIAIRIDELRLIKNSEEAFFSKVLHTLTQYIHDAQIQKLINRSLSAEDYALSMLGIVHTCLVYGKRMDYCQSLLIQFLDSIRL